MKKCVIGIDFGTLSGRAVLIDTENGKQLAESTLEYPHAVIDTTLPSGLKLGEGFALQAPEDYIEVLKTVIPNVMKSSGISAKEVVGVGVDFTTCTIIPTDENLTPLSFKEEFKNEPYAYARLWKHPSAQEEADEITELAKRRGEKWIKRYGGKLSNQFALPKILETLRKAPLVYDAAKRFIEGGDFITYILTGEEKHAQAFVGYKACWNEESGYPSDDFMCELDPRLSGIFGTKLSDKISPVSEIAGRVCNYGAELTGLEVGTPVALAVPDAHCALPALNVTDEDEMLLVLGTSACQIINSKIKYDVEGIFGYVKDGIYPGYYTYEAGQCSTGDIFSWFVKNYIPSGYENEAKARGISIHKLLREKAERLSPGESGLIALDWVGGNRNVLSDSDLRGMILGMSLHTKPEEIYRAWIEATAFGAKIIMENYENSGLIIKKICAAGGIAVKDPFLMQIYADVLEKNIRVAATTQAAALGSAIYASVAAGIFKNAIVAAKKLAPPSTVSYTPKKENSEIYRKLYEEYKILHDYFGRGQNEVMKRLGKLK